MIESDYLKEDTEEGLHITVKGSESSPDNRTAYFSFAARVTFEGFRGETEFEVPQNSVSQFTSDLNQLMNGSLEVAEIKCGWGDEIRFHLRLSRYDSRGNILVDCSLSQPIGVDRFNQCSVRYLVEFARLDDCLRFFERVAQSPPRFLTLQPQK